MKKTLLLSCVLLGGVLLTACQTQSNFLTLVAPQPTAPQFNNYHQQVMVNVASYDVRSKPEISSYVLDGQLHKLSAQPQVNQLFQQVMQQNLNSKGFRFANGGSANANVSLNIKHFYAQVEQGNLRYTINSKIEVDVVVQGVSGQFSKRLNSTRSQQGAFNAKNEEIQKVLNETLNDVVNSIYQDQEIPAAIMKYSR